MAKCEPCIKKKDKKKKEGQKEGNRRRTEKVSGEREKKEKKYLCFSLRSTEIEPWVFVGAKGKVGPRIESYAWVPKSWSFVKLHEVGNFPTLNIFSLKAMLWHRLSSGP